MTSTNCQLNSASRSHLPSHTRTPLSRSREASRYTVENILYSASRTPKSRVSKNARRRRRRLQAANVHNQTGIPSATQLPLDVTSTTDLQTASISHAPQETLTKDVIILESTIPSKSRAPQELQVSQDEPATTRVLETSPVIKQSLLLWNSQVLSPSSGDGIGRHTSEIGHHNASQLDELDREILAIGSVEQQYQSISTQPAVIQKIPLDDPEYQQVLPSSHKTLTHNLKHSRNVSECVSQDLTHVVHQNDASNNPISPAAKRRCQPVDISMTKPSAQRHNDNLSEPRSQTRRPKSKSKDINPKAPKKKRRMPDGGLSLGSYKAEPQFAETDEDQEMTLENDPIIVTQPSTPPSRQVRINEAELLEEPRKQKSKTTRRQNPAQRPFFSQINPAKFTMPLPCPSSPSVQALMRKIPSYRDGFEGSEARPTGNVMQIRTSRPRNPPVDPLSLRMGRLTIVESRSLRDDISPSPKPRNHSPTTIMEMDDESQLSANCQGAENVPAIEEVDSSKTCIVENLSAASISSAFPKPGCFQTRQKPKRQVTFSDEVGNIDDLQLPLPNISALARQLTLSDEEDGFDSPSDIEEQAFASGGEESNEMDGYDEHSGRNDRTSNQEDFATSVEMHSMTEEDLLLDTDCYEGESKHSRRTNGETVIQKKQHHSISSQKLRVVSGYQRV